MSSNESNEAGLKTNNTPAQKRRCNSNLYKYICFPQIMRYRAKILHVRGLIFNCKPFFPVIVFWCFSFSALGNDFAIDFTVHLYDDDSEVTSIIDLKTQVYGKVMITDNSGIPQNLNLHFREVTADTDDSPGDDEFPLIIDG